MANPILRAYSRFRPKSYVDFKLAQIDRSLRKLRSRKAADGRSVELEKAIGLHESDHYEFADWKTSLDDNAMLSRAKKMEIDIDEIIYEPTWIDSAGYHLVGRYQEYSTFGYIVLQDEFRKLLRKKVKEVEPDFKKRQREQIEFYFRIFSMTVTVLVGLIGALTGAVAILRH